MIGTPPFSFLMGVLLMNAGKVLLGIALVGAMLLIATPASAAILFEDQFTTTITPGTVWQAHGSGLPDGWGAPVAVGTEDSAALRFNSNAGTAEEVTGFETISPISLAGLPDIRIEARVAPLNQTGAGDGGASTASVGVKIVGSSGAFAQLSASANRPTGVDWADTYEDSEGSQDADVAFAHFDQVPAQAAPADGFRTFILDITPSGTTFTVLNTDLTVNSKLGGFNPNLTLADFGTDVTVALFQRRSDDTLTFPPSAPEATFGDVDRVTVSTTIPEPTSLMLVGVGAIGLAALIRARAT